MCGPDDDGAALGCVAFARPVERWALDSLKGPQISLYTRSICCRLKNKSEEKLMEKVRGEESRRIQEERIDVGFRGRSSVESRGE